MNLLRVLIGFALVASSIDATAQQRGIPDPVAAWVNYTRGLADRLRADVLRVATPAQRERLGQTTVEIHTRSNRSERICRYPTDLALTEERGADHVIFVCADNLRTMRFILEQSYAVAIMPMYAILGNEYLSEYYVMLAGYLHRMRRVPADELQFPCNIRYFLYLSSQSIPVTRCIGADVGQDQDYLRWLSNHDELIDRPRIVELRRASPWPDSTEPQFLANFQAQFVTDAIIVLLVFAIAHEYGHIANGETVDTPGDRCAAFNREMAADAFAVAVLHGRGIENRSDIALGQGPWLFLAAAANGMSGDDWVQSEVVGARVRTIVGAAQEDLRPALSDLAPGPNRGAIEALLSDPTIGPLMQDLDAWTECS